MHLHSYQRYLLVAAVAFLSVSLAIAGQSESDDIGEEGPKELFMKLYLFDNTSDALCNDGTPSGFYYRPGYGSGANRWIIHLQGGAWCYDQESCADRWESSPNLMSSLTWTPYVYKNRGIFNTFEEMNPSWYNANAVYLMYCTSDTWSGEGNVTYSDGTSWIFRGKSVISTAVSTLWSEPFGLSDATEVLFSGCSAGGQGVIVNLDYFTNQMHQHGSAAKIKGLADAGWLQNLVPWSGDIYAVPQSTQMSEGYTLWGGVVDHECALANPGWEWLCYFSPFGYSHITTPIMIQTEQYDTYQVTSNCCNPPFNQSESEYVATVRRAFAVSLQEIHGQNTYYSAACFHHCSSEDNSFFNIKINGYSMEQVLQNWYFEHPVGPTKAIDLCPGFNCSVGCPEQDY